MKIEEIDQLAEQRQNEIRDLTAKMEELPGLIEVAEEKATAAASAGDRDSYNGAAAERDSLKRDLEFAQIRLKALRSAPLVEPSVVTDAWNEYRAKYDRQMDRAIAEFEKAKQKALDAYAVMVDLQTASSVIRKRFGRYTGLTASDLTASPLSVRFPARMIPQRKNAAFDATGLLKMGGTTLNDPDAVYYLSDRILKKKEEKESYFPLTDTELPRLDGIISNGLIPD